MALLSAFHTILGFCCIALSLGATYSQTDSMSGSGFTDAFSYQAIADPTHGRV